MLADATRTAISNPLTSLSLTPIPRTLRHNLLEVQGYLENSCDPELEFPTTRNRTDSVLDIPEKEGNWIDNLEVC